jgi:flagellar biosynthesis/type III secretory pathway M-ring protein FliF/YscJ
VTLLAAPALPLHSAGKYVAGAYIAFVVMLVVYLGIMTIRTRRTQRELSELRGEVAERRAREELDGPELAQQAPGLEETGSRGRSENGSPGREETGSPEREPAV